MVKRWSIGLFGPDNVLRRIVVIPDPTPAGNAALWKAQNFLATSDEVALIVPTQPENFSRHA